MTPADVDRLPEAVALSLLDTAMLRCLANAIGNRELVSNFDRLWGANLSMRGKAIEKMIDEACGRLDRDVRAFVMFVYDCIYTRLEPETLAGLRAEAVSVLAAQAAAGEGE